MILLGPDGAPLERKSQTYTLEQLAGLAEYVRYGTASGATVTPETAVQVPAVLCAVRVLAEDVAGMPARIVRPELRGRHVARTALPDHWAARLLDFAPNSFQTPFEFKEYVMLSCLLDKGFLGIKVQVKGQTTEILPLPMGTWTVQGRVNDWNHYFQVSYADNSLGNFSPDQVVYMRGPSLDGWRGLPALQAAREAIGLASVLEKQQARLAGNGGKPSGVLTFDNELSPERRQKLAELWQTRFGPNGEGGVAILDRAAKFSSMTMTSVDAQTMEARNFQIEEVARAFRVHPNKLMHSGNQATFASAESFARDHVSSALAPWMRRFEEVMQRDLLGAEPDLRVDLDESAMLRGDFKDNAEFSAKALGSGGHPAWMTQNEVRARQGLDPIEDPAADELPQWQSGAEEPPADEEGEA